MPPRAVKKTSGGPSATKRTATRSVRGGPKPNAGAVEVKEEIKVEEVAPPAVAIKEEIKGEEVVEDKPVVRESIANGSGAIEDRDVKNTYEEEDKGERLELEDNETEYQETAVDYEERELIDDDGHEEEIEGEEEVVEDEVGEEEELEMTEEVEDVGEEAEEDYKENTEEENEVYEELEDHHHEVAERRKRKEFEVFVGGLDKDATEDDLRKVFTAVGDVVEVRLMMNPLTKKNKGFAFLRFATVEQAKRAVSELKNPVVNGKQCGVAPSKDNDTLFLGNICKTWTKEHLKDTLKSFGIDTFEDVNLLDDSNNAGTNRGFAFLEFSSRKEAIDAYRHMQKRDVRFGTDRPAKISLADSFIEPDDEIMAQVKTVFIDGIPASWDEDRVKGYLKEFGAIEKIELARNMPAAKRKDFGFVTFDTHGSAVKCAEGINNQELGEGSSKVKVRARLSRPLQKGRGKPGARGDFRTSRVALRSSGRSSWARPPPHRMPAHASRSLGGRGLSSGGHGSRRTIGLHDRRPIMPPTERVRRLPPPERPYERRPLGPEYPKASSKRDYSRQEELASRNRAVPDYGSRVLAERRPSFRDDYPSRGSSYSDIAPRNAPRVMDRRPYADEVYVRKPERPIPPYREGRSRDYDPIPGSKRPYSALDDAPRYADVSMRQSRARLDYGVGGSSAHYEDAYAERSGVGSGQAYLRLSRSHVGYAGSRSSLSGQDAHGLYGSRQDMSYGGGSVSGSNVGGMYSSSFSGSYLPRGSDVGSSSYSSLYPGRSLSGSGYYGGGGSGSYY